MKGMEKSDKTPNCYEKLAFIISETVPKYLRQFFIEHWDEKFPEQPWKSGRESSGTDLVNAIPENKKQKHLKKFNEYKDKLHCGNEEEWDTDILIDIMFDFGLDICDKSIKGDIAKLRNVSSQFASCKASKSCSRVESDRMMEDIIGAAKTLFQKDAEDEISKIWHSESETSKTDEQCMQPSNELKVDAESSSEHTSGKVLFEYKILLYRSESLLIFSSSA